MQKLYALLAAGGFRSDYFEDRKKQDLENILIASVGLVDQLVQFAARHSNNDDDSELNATAFAAKARALILNISDCVLASVLPN